MVCYAMSETPRCQCIVRDGQGNKVYEVTLPSITPATTLLAEVANKLQKLSHEISLVLQTSTQLVEITQSIVGTLEDLGFKTSYGRNSLIVQEITNTSNQQYNQDTSSSEACESNEAISETTKSNKTVKHKTTFANNDETRNYRRGMKVCDDNKSYSRRIEYDKDIKLPATSSRSPVYVGLVNQAMTCYLNSLLQALFMTPEFRNALYKWKFDGDKPTKSIPFQLQKLFLNLQTSSRCAVETTELTLSFGWGTGDVWHQHDVQELCRVMFDALEQEFKNTSQADLINYLYQGKMIDYVKCLECGREKSREDTFLDIPLPVRPYGSTVAYSSIEEAMRAFVTPEILDGNNQYYCENCNKKCNAHKGLKFSKFPYLLTLHLKRFDFDYSTMHRIKLNDKVVFPEILELDYFLKYPTSSGEMDPSTTTPTINNKYDDGSTSCSTADSALGDDTSAPPTLTHELNSPPTDHELNEDEGIVWDKSGVSLGGGSVSCSSSSGSYSGSEDNQPVVPPGLPPIAPQPPVTVCDSITMETRIPQPDQIVPQMEDSNKANPASETIVPLCIEKSNSKLTIEDVNKEEVASDINKPAGESLDSIQRITTDFVDLNSSKQTTTNTATDVDTSKQTSDSVADNDFNKQTADPNTDDPSSVDSKQKTAELRYELYSIMIHSGSASGGHYYAYIKDFLTNQWFCFNDQSVSTVTVEDIEKSYGGGPTRGYYSGVFSSSTNAYMLMYRFIDENRNSLPMTPEEFPQHIQELVEEMRAMEEQERRLRARDEEMVKIKVCYQSNQTKVFVHRDDPFSDALKQAYENLQLDTQVRREDCRLVSYCISRDSRDCSLEDKDNESMFNVLSYLKSNNCSTDFILETKHPNIAFPIYRPDDIRIDICRVNLPREEVLSIQQVQVPLGVKVQSLKHHLRLLMPELMPPPPTDLVLVMYHYNSSRFPRFHYMNDDQVHITQLLDQSTYNKIFVTPLTPSLAAQLENGFDKSSLYYFLRSVENVVILNMALPEVNQDVLERLMIPLLNDQKNLDNNNKQKDDANIITNNCQQDDENITGCSGNTVTTSDQSTSEDSSLTDSERTIIGEPPQLEGQLSSPSDSEQLSSPETNMTMEMNGEMEGDEDEDFITDRIDYYIKLTHYTDNSQRMVKIVVDRGAEWSLVEKWLEQCCGVPRQYLLVTTGSGELARSSDTIRSLFVRKHYDYLTVKLHRPLAHNEYKKKVYKFLPNSPQPFQYLCDWIMVRGQTVGESKRALLKYLDKRNILSIPYNRCRLRKKNWKAVGRPWLDSDLWDDLSRQPCGYSCELLIEDLDEEEEKVISHDLVPIFLKRVFPSKLSFSSFHELVIDTTQPFTLIKQISEISGIDIEHIFVAKSSYNFPWDMSVYLVLQDLDWTQDTQTLSNPNFCLDSDENTPIILYRDGREEKKKLQGNETEWGNDSCSRNSERFIRRSNERLATQSPRKEKPLKIYFQTKETTPPPPQLPVEPVKTSSTNENTSNCYVPPPDYD